MTDVAPTPKLIEIFKDTRGLATCKGCGKPIEWAEIVASGKKMCFDGRIVALGGRTYQTNGRHIEFVDLATNHWAVCPDRDKFRKKKA